MTYKPRPNETFNVQLDGRDLRVIGNSYRVPEENDIIGKIVPPDDVITADGYPRNIITVNGQFPSPDIEVGEGSQVNIAVCFLFVL